MRNDWLATLDFSNVKDHPTNDQYNVYRFYNPEQADFFEELLQKHKVQYERDNHLVDVATKAAEQELEEEKQQKDVYYFGIPKRLEKQVQKLNNLAIGKYRDPFIPNKGSALIFMLLILAILVFALVGYLSSPPVLP